MRLQHAKMDLGLLLDGNDNQTWLALDFYRAVLEDSSDFQANFQREDTGN